MSQRCRADKPQERKNRVTGLNLPAEMSTLKRFAFERARTKGGRASGSALQVDMIEHHRKELEKELAASPSMSIGTAAKFFSRETRRQQQTRPMVFTTIKDIMDQLPRAYSKDLYEQKCDTVYQHVYEAYLGQGKSVYAGN